MVLDQLHIDLAGHHELELRRHLHAGHGVQAFLLEVANPRREAKPESPAHGKNVVGETAGVGAMLVDDLELKMDA